MTTTSVQFKEEQRRGNLRGARILTVVPLHVGSNIPGRK
jgi:hypothetical protein